MCTACLTDGFEILCARYIILEHAICILYVSEGPKFPVTRNVCSQSLGSMGASADIGKAVPPPVIA